MLRQNCEPLLSACYCWAPNPYRAHEADKALDAAQEGDWPRQERPIVHPLSLPTPPLPENGGRGSP